MQEMWLPWTIRQFSALPTQKKVLARIEANGLPGHFWGFRAPGTGQNMTSPGN